MSKYRIMVVDDEESLCEILKFNLEKEGYEVVTANSAEEALALDLKGLDLMILDVMMGELSGYGLASILRKRPETEHLPIIFCSALDSESDKIKGLDLGADDYIAKPFSVAEVMARVRSVLRRSTHRTESQPKVVDENIIRYKELMINNLSKRCHINGEEVSLTRKEFDILAPLIVSGSSSRIC